MTVKIYPKVDNVLCSEHFYTYEFDCPCSYPDCTTTLISDELPPLLEEFRKAVGCSVHINSGYRCAKHNKDIGGEDHSQHLLGNATDVSRADGAHWTDTERLMAEHIFADHGLGTYILPNGRYLFLHLDVRPHKARWQIKV